MDINRELHLLKAGEVSQLLRKRFGIERTEKTLARYRSEELGPAYLKRPDGSVRYCEKDVMDWAQAFLAGASRYAPRYRQSRLFDV